MENLSHMKGDPSKLKGVIFYHVLECSECIIKVKCAISMMACDLVKVAFYVWFVETWSVDASLLSLMRGGASTLKL